MSRARQQSAWRALQWLPLLGALALLRALPTIAEASPAGVVVLPWRLDALTLTFMLSIAAAIALVPLQPRQAGVALAIAALLIPALLLEHLLALPAALLVAAVALRSRRWLLAAMLLSCALAWPYITAGAGWYDPLVAPAFTTPVAALLLAAVAVALAPWPRLSDADPLQLALLPIWLLPVLRAIGLQPWRSELGLLALAAGCAFAVSSAAAALRDANRLSAAVARGWLAFAFAASGLLTTAGMAAALYCLLAYPLGLGLLLRAPRLAPPLPLTSGFVASWLVVGAVSAAGAWPAAAALLLAAVASGVALLGPYPQPLSRVSAQESAARFPLSRASARERGLGGEGQSEGQGRITLAASWALGIAAPPVIEYLILPAVDLLQGGLTPFGLLAVWPWIGIAVLDAGQRRVTTLPAIAMLLLLLVCAAGAWLVARGITRRSRRPPAVSGAAPGRVQRVWWLGDRGGG